MVPFKLFIILILNLGFIPDMCRPFSDGTSEFPGVESTTESCGSGTNNSCIVGTTESESLTENNDLVTGPTSVPTNTNLSTKETNGAEPTVSNDSSVTEISIDVGTVKDLSPSSDDHCFCDITLNECDVNCCCDIDCSGFDRAAFSECYIRPSSTAKHSGLCLYSEYVYKNNTEYSLVTTDSGMFCIVRDNYPDRLKYTEEHAIESLEKFYKVLLRKKHYAWPASSRIADPKFEPGQPLRFGTPLWQYINDTEKEAFKVFEFPAPVVTTSLCNSAKQLLYLVNENTECLHPVPKTKEECTLANYNVLKYLEPFLLVSSPLLVNSTQYSASPAEAFLRLDLFVCSGSTACSEEPSPLPASSFRNGTCDNLITSVRIEIKHNGSFGLVQARTFVRLTDVAPASSDTFIRRYQLVFDWARNNSSSAEVLRRSGRPGYISGKPLITSRRIMEAAGVQQKPANGGSMSLSGNQKDWISFATSTSSSGYPNCGKRINLLFNQNLRTQCTFRFKKEMTASTNCSLLQNQVWKLLLGDAEVNKTDTERLDLYIASYGDPFSPDNSLEWVPIWLETAPSYRPSEPARKTPCFNILSSISLNVIYSQVGSLVHPQAKIIGASVKTSESRVVCDRGEYCQVQIVSSVLFIDVSNRPERKFAEPPVIKVKLPEDFFYPFLSAGSTRLSYSVISFITVLLLLETH